MLGNTQKDRIKKKLQQGHDQAAKYPGDQEELTASRRGEPCIQTKNLVRQTTAHPDKHQKKHDQAKGKVNQPAPARQRWWRARGATVGSGP